MLVSCGRHTQERGAHTSAYTLCSVHAARHAKACATSFYAARSRSPLDPPGAFLLRHGAFVRQRRVGRDVTRRVARHTNSRRRVGRAATRYCASNAPERVAARRVCGGAGRSAGWGGNRRGGGEHRGWGILKTRARYGDGVVYTTEHFCTVLFTALHLCTVDVCGTGRLQGGCEARTSPELLPRRSCRLES